MTTTVKGAGRTRHAGSRKHQQRTPLPPKHNRNDLPKNALRFLSSADEAGWKTNWSISGVWARVQAHLDGSVLELAWRNGTYAYEEALHTVDGRTRKVRNVSEAEKIMTNGRLAPKPAGTPPGRKPSNGHAGRPPRKTQPFKPEQPKTKEQVFKPNFGEDGKPHRRPRRKLPFDPDQSTAEYIIDMVRGRKLTWLNRTSGKEESGQVMKLAKSIQVIDCIDNRRAITFPQEHGGTIRTVFIDQILSVK